MSKIVLERLKGPSVDISGLTFLEAMEKLWQMTAEGWEVDSIEVLENSVTAYMHRVLEKYR